VPEILLAATHVPDYDIHSAGELPPVEDTVVIPIQLCNLPPFYPVATQLLHLNTDAHLDTRRVTSIAGSDPAIAAEVLFLANSSLFGFPSRIRTLAHAVALLGIDRIKALAVTVAVRALSQGGGPAVRTCWRHSVATAAISSCLAKIFGGSEDAAYTAALLHDVGRLGLLKALPGQFDPLFARSYPDGPALIRVERAEAHMDHTTAGSRLAERWTLPDSFGEICGHHHDPIGERDSHLLQTIKVACKLADALGYSVVHFTDADDYSGVMNSMPLHLRDVFFPLEHELRDHIETALTALGG
jgi:putative nucleotidyltransferase with HDIG domain